jgi:hypothetical protein
VVLKLGTVFFIFPLREISFSELNPLLSSLFNASAFGRRRDIYEQDKSDYLGLATGFI